MTIERLNLDTFLIDIIDDGENYEAWLYVKGYCTKTFMLGMPKAQQSKEEFRKLAIANFAEYGEQYLAEYGE